MRAIYLVAGHLSLAVGIVGIFVPLLPTTPFLLLTSYCYSQASQRFHRWLHNHPRLGPPILNWQRHGVIRKPVKIFATVFLIVGLAYPIAFKDFSWFLKAFAIFTGVAVLTFIWSRPAEPPRE